MKLAEDSLPEALGLCDVLNGRIYSNTSYDRPIGNSNDGDSNDGDSTRRESVLQNNIVKLV